MNLHEECLLKYLVNPLELYYTTELLKHNNSLLEEFIEKNEVVENRQVKMKNCL